jgi:AcrR family transcriptional regulator
MNKPQERGVLKRAKILQSAGELFAKHGYEKTTFAMVARASGAAIGSIEHFFCHKPGLATAVHEDVVAQLTALIEQVIARHGYDIFGAITELMPAYFRWAAANPHHQRIMNVLTDYALEFGPSRVKGLQARVEPLLLDLATTFKKNGSLRSLTAPQLFALIVAPAMASAIQEINHETTEIKNAPEWPSTLASIAIEAIKLPTAQPVPAARTKTTRNARVTTSPPIRNS